MEVLPAVSLSPHVQVSFQSDSPGFLSCTCRPSAPAIVKPQLPAASWACLLSDTITFLSSQRQFDLSAVAALLLPFTTPMLPVIPSEIRWSEPQQPDLSLLLSIDFPSSVLLLGSVKKTKVRAGTRGDYGEDTPFTPATRPHAPSRDDKIHGYYFLSCYWPPG